MQESEINIDRHLGKQNWFKDPVSMLYHCDSMMEILSVMRFLCLDEPETFSQGWISTSP